MFWQTWSGSLAGPLSTVSLASQITLYLCLALIGLYALLVFGWQILVLKGKATLFYYQ